ncbi:MAG: hypothetical protein K0U98_11935 [Deltaproteobacteria bacterium]|nr:hypothetical protein [Deltaproteobacteria bacterium]
MSLEAEAGGLLANTTFDVDTAGWEDHDGSVLTWNTGDADGSPTSGSAALEFNGKNPVVVEMRSSCVLLGEGDMIEVSVQFSSLSLFGNDGRSNIEFFSDESCSESLGRELSDPQGSTGNWVLITQPLQRPPSAVAAILRLEASIVPGFPPFVLFDNVALSTDVEAVFCDDFESGDTSEWAGSLP